MRWWPWQKKNEKKRAYAAARFDRTVADWILMNTSADAEIKTSLPALRTRSRDLGRNNDYVRAAFRDLQVNVVGKGVGFQAQVKMQRGGALNQVLNDQIETAWCRWSRKQHCHVAGKLSFSDIERVAIRSIAESGEILIRIITQSFGGGKIPLALEVIESDQLDDTYNGIAANGNAIRMGVEFDRWSRPEAYYLLPKHPGDFPFGTTSVQNQQTKKHIRVPAEEIIHLMITDRPGQTRGVPWLVSAILRLRHMGGFEEASVISARASAAVMGFIETPDGELHGDGTDGDQRVTDFEPGIFKQMNPGEKVNVPNFGTPNAQFDSFMRSMLRGFASGIGGSATTISGDFSQSNYSSSRLELLTVRDFYQIIQGWMIENFHQVVYERWLDLAVLSGALSLPKFEVNPEAYYEACKWQPRGWQWVDPAKDVQASRDAVAAGFMTQSDVIAQMGGDFDDVITRRKYELDVAKENDLEFESEAGGKASGMPSEAPPASLQNTD